MEKLVNQTNDLITAHSDNMSQESVMAAKSMIDEHNFLIKPLNPLTLDFRDFIESALNIVNRYEHKLEAAPGFFNQFKSFFNSFIEKLTGKRTCCL